MSVYLYILIGVLGLGYLWVKKCYRYWSDRGFESPKASFPFGSLKGVATKFTSAEAVDIIYKKYKGKAPAVGFYTFLSPTLLPIDPELYKNILVRDFSSFHDRGFYYNKEDDPLSANILSLEGPEWKDRRVKLSPIFTSGKMKMMFEIVNTIGDKLVKVVNEDLKTSSVLEMRILAAKYTSDVIGNVAFGLECNCLDDPKSEFMKHGRRLFDLSAFELLRFFFCNIFPEFSRKIGIRLNAKEPSDFFLRTFLETFEYREKSQIKRTDFVSLLLGLKEYFTPTELAAEAFLVYSGGFETSSTLMTFTMYELALNPDIQERLRDEIKSQLEESDGKITYDALFDMKYLDMVINESLRKYPPIPNGIRKCTKEYKIPGTSLIIPEGMAIELATYSLHHDPENFPEPEKFDPERFSPENIKSQIPFTFLPFGDGPRNCLGMRFGLMQSKLGIVKLLQNFEISTSSKTPIPMKFTPASPFLAPVGGMSLTMKKLTE